MHFIQHRILQTTQKIGCFFRGGYGCGKTHLAAAITNKAIENQIKTLFLTAPDLLDLLRRAYQNPSITFEQQMEEILNIPLLIIDDFGTQNATDWAEEKNIPDN